MERIYTEANISKSISSGGWEEDKNGNPIIIIEASNENLDFDGEKVLREALLNSKDYFMQNGVISYDHKHLPHPDNYKYDPDWNEEKYILGKPLDAWEGIDKKGNPVVKVKAVLSRSNERAKEIIKKLSDGLETVKASVGGRRVRKQMRMDTGKFKEIPTIVGVNWDEVALTYKPVNQTLGPTVLCPVDFVKSLTAGNSVDPGNMGTGGNTLQRQSRVESIKGLFNKIRNNEIGKSSEMIDYLEKAGYSPSESKLISKLMINKNLGDVVMAKDRDANGVIDASTDELEKALKDLESMNLAKSKKKDGRYVTKGGFDYLEKSDGTYEKMDDDAPDYNGDGDDEGKEGKTEKSLDFEDIDVTEDIDKLHVDMSFLKSQNEELTSMVKSLIAGFGSQSVVLKSMGDVMVGESKLLKSMSDAPGNRQTTNGKIVVSERFQKSQIDKLKTVNQSSMMKSMIDAGVSPAERNEADIIFRKSGIAGVVLAKPQIAEILTKE